MVNGKNIGKMKIYTCNANQKTIKQMEKDFADIASMIVCVGGPLNDNVLGYNNKQLKIFRDILNIARCWEECGE